MAVAPKAALRLRLNFEVARCHWCSLGAVALRLPGSGLSCSLKTGLCACANTVASCHHGQIASDQPQPGRRDACRGTWPRRRAGGYDPPDSESDPANGAVGQLWPARRPHAAQGGF